MPVYESKEAAGGVLLDIRNETDVMMDVAYASLTAPRVVQCVIIVDNELHDKVFAGAGGSHSWWTQAGGKFLPPRGLQPGQRVVVIVDGPAALRVDWC